MKGLLSIRIATIAAAMSLAACAMQPAPPPPPPPPPPPAAMHAPPPAAATLYQRLGGKDAIVAVVDDFVANVAHDKRINRYFAKANIPRLKAGLVNQICQATGGPCVYTGPNMRDLHHGMRITNAAFDALVGDLVKTLNKFKVPAREQQELLAILGPMRKDIVNV